MKPRVFSVVTNQTQYHALVKQNPFLKDCICHFATNTPACNISVATHYNRFINEKILPEKQEGWVIFCHQDFEWLEDPAAVLDKLDPQIIYGPTGMQRIEYHWGSYKFTTGKSYCQFPAGPFVVGIYSVHPQPVDTLDCCCVCVHSSLLKKYSLRFDDVFDFHCYVEDFCLNAREKGVQVYAIQLHCKHYSNGKLSRLFFERYNTLLHKYPQSLFVTPLVKIRWGAKGHFPSYHTLPLFWLLVNGLILPFKTLRAKTTHYLRHMSK